MKSDPQKVDKERELKGFFRCHGDAAHNKKLPKGKNRFETKPSV